MPLLGLWLSVKSGIELTLDKLTLVVGYRWTFPAKSNISLLNWWLIAIGERMRYRDSDYEMLGTPFRYSGQPQMGNWGTRKGELRSRDLCSSSS
jgi:hypothetical protein